MLSLSLKKYFNVHLDRQKSSLIDLWQRSLLSSKIVFEKQKMIQKLFSSIFSHCLKESIELWSMKVGNGKRVNRIGRIIVLILFPFLSLKNVSGNATVVEEYGWTFFHAQIQCRAGVNFTNVLHAAFTYVSCARSFFVPTF